MRRAIWVLALLALTFTAACSSSGGDPSPAPVGPTTPDSTTAPPPAETTPSAPPSSSTPVPTASSSGQPLSPYEKDPGVQALRAWAAQASATINAGHADSAALDALMTAKLKKSIGQILGNSVGYKYPGPLPFTPTRVDVASSGGRAISACFVTNGYGIDPKTGKPHGKYHVTPINVQVRRVHQQWLLDVFGPGSFSCKGVEIEKRA